MPPCFRLRNQSWMVFPKPGTATDLPERIQNVVMALSDSPAATARTGIFVCDTFFPTEQHEESTTHHLVFDSEKCHIVLDQTRFPVCKFALWQDTILLKVRVPIEEWDNAVVNEANQGGVVSEHQKDANRGA